MKFGSLFAGIGGMDLGLERAGMECRWQVEVDPFCLKILAKHWPDVSRWGDVKTFDPRDFAEVDLICGGFPCQDISIAGRGEGINGSRSGLWSEFARIIRLARPQFVLVENVPAITHRGLDIVLRDLAQCGYDAEWQTISACAFGAPHMRRRVFILAYPQSVVGSEGIWGKHGYDREISTTSFKADRRNWMEYVRRVDGIVNGVSNRVDRVKGLGNAVVPQVVEWIGRQILQCMNEKTLPLHTEGRCV